MAGAGEAAELPQAQRGGAADGGSDPWLTDVVTEVAALETTGGKVWGAAHELAAFLEQRAPELALGRGRRQRVLEIGAGCGWLGMVLARNAPSAEVCMTEQLAGLEHLERNIALNRAAGVPVDGVRAVVLDWADHATSELLREPWDLVIGSDLLYTAKGLTNLVAVFGVLAGPSTRLLYAHTLHRFDHLDVDFFSDLEAAGLQIRELGSVAEEAEAFLEELFPEERVAVFEISYATGSRSCTLPLLEARDMEKRCVATPAVAKSAQEEVACSIKDHDLGISIILPSDGAGKMNEQIKECPDMPILRLPVVGPFGNATHPTTRLVLRWLAESKAVRSRKVCDYGCGSGVLSLAALLHGADRCAGVDLDPAALAATSANAEANGLSLRIHLPPSEVLDRDLDFFSRFGDWRQRTDAWTPLPREGDCAGAFDVVLCNIVVGPLCRVAPTLAELCRPGGIVALAGFRCGMRQQVEDAYGSAFDLADGGQDGGWRLLIGTRRA